jgi:hypothetical protein
MRLTSHAVTFGAGYLLAQPDIRHRLDQLRRQAVELGRPRARQMREHLWDTAGDALLTAKRAAERRGRRRRADAAAEAAFRGPILPDAA